MNIVKKQWSLNKRNEISSAWKGLEDYIIPIVEAFNIAPNIALEFGVDLGYSADIFSQVFKKVIGVDSFTGDKHIVHEQGEDFYNKVKDSFKGSNVDIIRSNFEDFIENNNYHYDLIHIDIVHEYEPTYNCANWAVQHSNVVILHDTESFPEIKKVCHDISSIHNLNFYNIYEHHGLGVIYKI